MSLAFLEKRPGLFIPYQARQRHRRERVATQYGWVAIAMSKAQAQKHRAVSLDTDENTQSPEEIWRLFLCNHSEKAKLMENKIVRISLAGGLIGLFTTNPRKALEDVVKAQNDMGFRCTYFYPNHAPNLLIRLLQLIVLVCTLGLWTWGAGYLVLLEKNAK